MKTELFDFTIQYPNRPEQTIRVTRDELAQLTKGYRVISSVRLTETERINIALSGQFDKMELARLLWPDSKPNSQRVMIDRLIRDGVKQTTIDRWKTMIDYFSL